MSRRVTHAVTGAYCPCAREVLASRHTRKGSRGMTVEEHARVQVLFRAVNERIAGTNRGVVGAAPFEVVCECGGRECAHARIRLTPAEYERVRSNPTHFILVTAHVADDLDRIVAVGEGYVVTASTGVAGELARATDPRSAPQAPVPAS